jgi:DNA polymerase-1
VYEACRANEECINWGDDLWTLHSFFQPTAQHFDDLVSEVQENTQADEVVMALSDYDDPWRKRVMPSYKSNRKEVRKPVTYTPMRAYIHEKYRTYQRPGLEGDDVLGILLTNPSIIQGEKIVVSLDKDMKTLPGLHINLKRARDLNDWEPFRIKRHQADYHHMLQTLTGDATDGYPGCPGVGPVGAKKILDPYFTDDPDEGGKFLAELAWPAIVKAYEKAKLNEEVALQNAQVARILRHGDYDYDKKEVRLWNPK